MNINEIAAMAGVSRTTVSRALNGGYVSQEARRKIEEAIQKTGYVPSVQAKAFRTRKSGLIGLLVVALDSEILMQMADRLLDRLEQAGYQTILMRYQESKARLHEQARQLCSRGVEGLIVFTIDDDAQTEAELTALPAPVVTVGPVCFAHLPGVCHDDYASFCVLTQAALDRGYRRIGTLFPGGDHAIGRLRHAAIADTLAKNGLALRPQDCLYGAAEAVPHLQLGQQLGEQFLQLTDRPRLLIAATDAIAVGAYRVLASAGLRVPEDVALMGYGNTELGRMMLPALSTVESNRMEIADKAVALLLNRIHKNETIPEKIHVKPLLALRDSI